MLVQMDGLNVMLIIEPVIQNTALLTTHLFLSVMVAPVLVD